MSGRIVLAAAVAIVLAGTASAADISGPARVIDGDTLVIGTQHIRLFGVDAPERAQACGDGSGVVMCGQDATRALRALVGATDVSCERKGTDRYARTVAVCRVGGLDIGAEMVRAGHAIDYRQYSHGAYAAQQAEAQRNKAGIWASDFVDPATWRRDHRH